jgi:hypothetical protein
VLQKFHAEVLQSSPVTLLHTLTCVNCGTHGEPVRVVRARNISEAMLDLIATYMSAGVRRNVAACRCTKERNILARQF